MKKKIALIALAAAAVGAQAADWSDTSLSFARGSKFAEPSGKNEITKNIYSLTHASGYKYGSNFFNVDMLDSAPSDPAFADANTGAHEVYVIYRNTVDLSKVTSKSFKTTGVRGLGVTGGFDFNSKADKGYNSKKEMAVLGPTIFVDVPSGFLNVSVLQLWESQSAKFSDSSAFERFHYKPHKMLNIAWSIPFKAYVPLEFQGTANFIDEKGKSGASNSAVDTAPETFIDVRLMYDIGAATGVAPNTFKIGAEYQYWKNKFGNDYTKNNPGAFAKTPMVRAEYHF